MSYHYAQIRQINSSDIVIPYDVQKFGHHWFRQWLVRRAIQRHISSLHRCQLKLEQVARLRSEYTLHRPMITHTIESYWIPSQKKTKPKLQI